MRTLNLHRTPLLTAPVAAWLVVLLLAAAPQCASAQTDNSDLSLNEVASRDTLRMATSAEQAAERFAQALLAQKRGQDEQAQTLLEQVLELQPDHVGALYELAARHHDQDADSVALAEMERAAELDPRNYWIRQSLAELYASLGREDDAIAQLERLAHDYPRNSDLLAQLAGRYATRQDYEATVRTLDRIELLEGKSERLSMQKFRCYVQMKDERRAFDEIRALADEYPADVRYQVLIGDLYLDQGHTDKAYAEYQRIGREHPDNLALQVSLMNYYQQTGQDSLLTSAMQRVAASSQLDSDALMRLLQSVVYNDLQQRGDTARVMPLLRTALARPDATAPVCELAARYMVTRDLPAAQIRPVLEQMLTLDPTSLLARSQLLKYAVEAEDTAELIRVCEGAAAVNLPDPVFYYYLGIAYLQQRRNADAAQAMERGLAKSNDHTNLQMVTNMYSILGDLYHELGNDKRAYEMYDSCLLYRPDEALVLNNYAYYLSLEGRDLDKAAAMSLRSLEKEGHNPTYLDTYAWILFRQKKYEEARAVVDTLLTLLPSDSLTAADATLLEHAGDIYSKCGRADEAVDFWTEAAQLYQTGTSDDPAEQAEGAERVARKIKKRKYTE